ncbi:MAG TPA: GNAT family N-acetyltransferase [Kofleriaceae bacterium]|nr:GNAT family N-acetyltransferase [Kofleriaceae bacterium]
MTVTTTRDRTVLRARLRRHAALHLYELGDLDDFFWPHTTWFVDGEGVALLYTPPGTAVLLAFAADDELAPLAALVDEIRDQLPAELYAHVSPPIVPVLARRYEVSSGGVHDKMALADRSRLGDGGGASQLGPGDVDELVAFYARCYPGNWFDPRMLETRQYFAIREAGALVAAAGIHVYSATERVAALGNIATAPEQRRRGLAARVTSALCRSLLASVDQIGLNVKATNDAAISCYKQLGFVRVAAYEELALRRR